MKFVGHFPRILILLALLLPSQPAAAPARAAPDFSNWHLPVPAGEWLVSRGPCNALTPFDHNCIYYEERCAIDLIPVLGSMENMPVLAPQAGQVFFMGTRDDAGLTLLLLHSSGRVSGFMHLSRIVVGPDEAVTQGQVVAYAGHTGLSSGNPHLHFFVQPNAVERDCLPLEGLDEIDYLLGKARSHNLKWEELILPDPPQSLIDQLPPLTASQVGVRLSTHILLSLGSSIRVPLVLTGTLTSTLYLQCACAKLTPIERTDAYVLFRVPLTALSPGDFAPPIFPHTKTQTSNQLAIRLHYRVRLKPDTRGSRGILLINPSLVSPSSYSRFDQPPELCWSLHRTAGQAPFEFRVVVVGPKPADSGWLNDTCWQPPNLSSGTYYWKVFVRDARGYMNRTNQRPFAFVIR
jgi:hypothetical protein